jgi:UDP-N-acetylmuramoylalanine--D-glutamate ligase
MKKTAVVGLGVTGKSVLAYLHAQGDQLIACDTRSELAGIDAIKQQYPAVQLHLGSLESLLDTQFDRVVVSPGVSLQEPVLQQLIDQGIPVLSDIDLFLQVNTAPVVAITGSNGKTTVTTWVGECLKSLGYRVQVCGNIGEPVLAGLQTEVDYVVMELSSFQLDASGSINADVAVCLNITPDHLDRHGSLDHYIAAKMRVYTGAKTAIVNTDTGYHYQPTQSQSLQTVLSIAEFSQQPLQQRANREAVVTILVALDIDKQPAIQAASQCQALRHRFQSVATVEGVHYINDSKATNVGAAIAAMQAAKAQAERVIVIAGGQSKAAPLQEWAQVAEQCASGIILYGEDAELMQQALNRTARRVENLAAAVEAAHTQAKEGDIVLLAPAAASFDQFSGYEARGDRFIELVNQLK